MNRWVLFIVVAAGLPHFEAGAQNLTIQQPVVGSTSASTSMSVPDRGRTLIGGFGSAGSAQKRYGAIPSGPSQGRFTRSSSISVGVHIQDFGELDRQALLAAERLSSKSLRSKSSPGIAEPASHALEARSQAVRSPMPSTVEDRFKSSSADAAIARHLAAARRAAERGDSRVAELHYRLARKHGN